MAEQALEGEVVDEVQEQEGQAAGGKEPEVPGELVARPDAGQVIQPLDLESTRAAMTTYQEGLRSLLTEDDYQNAGSGRKFVKKSGWRKIATWFGLSVELVRDEADRDDSGQVTRATVWARAIAPNGRSFDGDGHCDIKEDRFKDASGRKKIENDLRATATTRAVNRAISGLVGMGAVSAEEMEGTTITETEPEATKEEKAKTQAALMFLFDDPITAEDAWGKIKEQHPSKTLKGAVARAVTETIRIYRDTMTNEGDTDARTRTDARAEGAGSEAGAEGEAPSAD